MKMMRESQFSNRKEDKGHISSLFSRSDGSEKKMHSLCVTIFLTTVTL